ncbi:MAG: NusG domain II-containing protein [Candidatus Margulisbacteria bacterium]|nr:NusG domain II-containing protein [Candidatus Margulisiibacteriota bacterium]
MMQNNKNFFYNISFSDLVLAALIVFIALYLLTGQITLFGTHHKTVRIYEQGKLIKETDLEHPGLIRLDKMQLIISKGKIRVFEVNCPLQICKNTGWISEPNQIIVCVPNKILVEITGQAADSAYHGITK